MSYTPKVDKAAVAVATRDLTPTEGQFKDAVEGVKVGDDEHLRFVNTSRREIADTRVRQGYRALEGEQARTIGELRLMKCSKAEFEKREAARLELDRQRVGQFRKQGIAAVEKEGMKPITEEEV